jgi:hypothetical protein
MFYKIFYIVLCFSVNILACSSVATSISTQNHEHLPVGGRSGLHGMVVFGAGPYFIEHIPMLQSPHDFQIVAQIVLKDQTGKILRPNLSEQGFTLKPNSKFSLNDFVGRKLKLFKASLYQGSFEQDGKLLKGFESIEVEVSEILLARQLPDKSSNAFFEVSDSLYVYETQVITPENNTQLIKNKSKLHTLWCVKGPDFYEFCQ